MTTAIKLSPITTNTPDNYASGFKKMLDSGECTLELANKVNHLALEMHLITMEHFSKAANVLAKAILAR